MSIRKKIGLMFMLVLMLVYSVQPLLQVSAAPADGTYSAAYVVKKAEDESVSMANDYFEKPAQLTVSGGKTKVRLQLNHSEWITDFQVPGSNVKVVSSNKTADTRVLEFEVKNVAEPVIAKIHVTVPSIDYDHDYTVRFVFEAGKLKSAAPVATKKPAVKPAPTKKPAVKPAPTKKPAVKPAATKKPAVTPVPTKKPVVKPVATKKPAVTPVPTKKPVVTPAPTKKPIAAVVSEKPVATAVATEKPTVVAVSTEAPAQLASEETAPKLNKTLLSSGAAVLFVAAGYAVLRARKK